MTKTNELNELIKIREILQNGNINLGDENPSNQQDNSFPAPYIKSISPSALVGGEQTKIKIHGSFFTPNTIVTISGQAIARIIFVSDNLIEIDVSAGTNLGSFDLVVNNGKETIITDAIKIIDYLGWDFRYGNFNQAIEKSSATEINVTDYWIGLNVAFGVGWKGFIRFFGDNDQFVWSRNISNSLSWILFPKGMVGIGSRESGVNANNQQWQNEILGHFDNDQFIGLYGNNGTPGASRIQYVNFPLEGVEIIKLTITNNGEAGGKWFIYDLTPDDTGWESSGLTREQYLSQQLTRSHFFDESKLIVSGIIEEQMTANAEEIMPSLAFPDAYSIRVIGFYLENTEK